jgi:hypothetical protein
VGGVGSAELILVLNFKKDSKFENLKNKIEKEGERRNNTTNTFNIHI